MSYVKAKEKYERAEHDTPPAEVRDYSCKARGCRNAGTSADGVCYYHWRESDATKWAAITWQIDQTWPEMANWGREKTELEARKAAQRRALRNAKPTGLVTSRGGS